MLVEDHIPGYASEYMRLFSMQSAADGREGWLHRQMLQQQFRYEASAQQQEQRQAQRKQQDARLNQQMQQYLAQQQKQMRGGQPGS